MRSRAKSQLALLSSAASVRADERNGDAQRADHGDESRRGHDDEVGDDGDGRDLVEIDGGDRLGDDGGGDAGSEQEGRAEPEALLELLRGRKQCGGQKGIGREGTGEEAHQRRRDENQAEDDAEGELRAGIEQHGGIPDEHGQKGERPAAERVERTPQPPRQEDGEGHDGGADGAGGRAGEQAVEQHDGRDRPRPAPADEAAELQQDQRDDDHLGDVLAADGEDVERAGAAEILLDVGGNFLAVTDEHAGEEIGHARIVLEADLEPRVGPVARAEGEILAASRRRRFRCGASSSEGMVA